MELVRGGVARVDSNELQPMRDRVATFVLPPRRSHRSYPRAVEVQMSNHAKKLTKRSQGSAKNVS